MGLNEVLGKDACTGSSGKDWCRAFACSPLSSDLRFGLPPVQ